MTLSLLPDVRLGYQAGLNLLPVAEDGTKRPALPEWKLWKSQRVTPTEMRQWDFAHRTGYGMVAGPVSNYTESWDFDDAVTFEGFVAAAAATGLASVIQQIREGYEDQTPNGGVRWIVHYPPEVTWVDTTYARRPGRPGEKPVVTLIETTLFAVLAPSHGAVHPSGRPYVRVRGSFKTIASYSLQTRADVIALARSFDQMPRRVVQEPRASATGTRPGDDFNRRVSWDDVLSAHGWTAVGSHGGRDYWCRPGKTHGISASASHETGLLWMFTSSTPFEQEKSYSKFAAYALLEHGEDYAAAARALGQQGYGTASRSTTGTSSGPTPPTRELQMTAATAMRIRPVDWLWQDRVALGALTLLGGREGIGKSLCTTDLTAQITTGVLPGKLYGQPRTVFIAAAEDSWEHTIVPRLMAAQADLSRVFRIDVKTVEGFTVPLSLPVDLVALEAAVRQQQAALLVFDPLLSRLEGSLDTHKDADVRRALEPLAAMAERVKVALIGLIHVTKSHSSDALTLLMGSRGFAGVARAVLFAMTDPDEASRRLLGQPKNNLGRTNFPTLTFEVEGVRVATTAEGEIWTGHLVWGAPTERTIQEALESLADQQSDREQLMDAQAWLRDYLTDAGGTGAVVTILNAARAAGFSRAAIYRAQARVQLQHDYRGFPRKAYWILSSQLSQSQGAMGSETLGETPGETPVVSRETTTETTETPAVSRETTTETTETTETTSAGVSECVSGSWHPETETTETTEPQPLGTVPDDDDDGEPF